MGLVKPEERASRRFTTEEYQAHFAPKGIVFRKTAGKILVRGVFEGPISLETGPDGYFAVGAYSHIRAGTVARDAYVGRYTAIATGVQIGAPEHPTDWIGNSSIFMHKYAWAHPRPWTTQSGIIHRETRIGNDVLISRNAFVKTGVTIGHGAVIGASSVVTKDVPPYAVVVGVPARVVKYRFPEELIERLLAAEWWNYDPEFLRHLDIRDAEAVVSFIEKNGAELAPFTPPSFSFSTR
jgi:virginiamycin A acetyltransferase